MKGILQYGVNMENRFKAEEAGRYDDVIRRRVPLYNEIQTLIVSLLPFSRKEYLRVLDLGCGTGGTSVALLKEFPLARVTGIDSSSDMLDAAAAKVKHTTWRIDFVCQDIRVVSGQWPVVRDEGEFDVIISAFSLHYLTEDEKKALFSKCYDALKPGGIFIDAEAVISPFANVYQLYMEKWKEFQFSNGFSEDETGAQMLKFVRDVKPLTVERQLGLMSDAGFADVECYFKYLNWAVFGGYKQGQGMPCPCSHAAHL
ncbi:MAG: class I SAM-dependent methyltransferase [Deltaproteobacteria bacterium]|nr:class I SAM-dependent methyltransferase [Deltaproteobacteria bacterium]